MCVKGQNKKKQQLNYPSLGIQTNTNCASMTCYGCISGVPAGVDTLIGFVGILYLQLYLLLIF